ncbi:hypothetical protein FRC08_009254 [Ceratobasidium sp. 394]|nr:hypothetical protein FRC08_009254 [Ceratobasidium sp. 394]
MINERTAGPASGRVPGMSSPSPRPLPTTPPAETAGDEAHQAASMPVVSIEERLAALERDAADQSRVIGQQSFTLERMEGMLGELLQAHRNSENESTGRAVPNESDRTFIHVAERDHGYASSVTGRGSRRSESDDEMADDEDIDIEPDGAGSQRHGSRPSRRVRRFLRRQESHREEAQGLPPIREQGSLPGQEDPVPHRGQSTRRRDELYEPSAEQSMPAPAAPQQRRVSIAEPQRDQPPHMTSWSAVPRRASGPFAQTAAGPTPVLRSRLYQQPFPVPATPHGQVTLGVGTPTPVPQPAAASTPRAAGYPIGAIPTDNVSRDIIRALQRHQSDTLATAGQLQKVLKLGGPPTYDGSGELKTFEQWVTDLLRWLRLHGLLGPDADMHRVSIIGVACKDAAKDWYQHAVDRGEHGPESWTTLEVIQGLQRRFITPRSTAEIGQEFRLLQQGTMATVELYQQLLNLSVQLPTEPDPYSFRRRFMEALHPRIAQRVMGLAYSAERSEIDVLVEVAEAQEAALASQRHFDEVKPSGGSSKKRDRDRPRKAADTSAGAALAPRPATAPVKTTDPKDRGRPASQKREPGRCFRCNRTGHIAAACPNAAAVVHGKAAVVVDDRSASENEPVLHSARADPADEAGPDAPPTDGATSESDVSEDSLWGRFDDTFGISARACTIVPLADEVDVRAAKVHGRRPDPEAEPVHNPAVRRRPAPSADGQPVRVPHEQRPITGYYRIGGTLAHVMFDSGSGTDMVSPEFVRATRLKPIELENPVGLQMALIGSRGKINFGLNASLEVGPVSRPHYFDVANIEKYDAILGLPFLKQAKAHLDFDTDEVVIDSTRLPSQYRADAPAAARSRRDRRSTRPEPPRSGMGE